MPDISPLRTKVPPVVAEAMANRAWSVRARARIIGPTAVGCAALTDTHEIYVGCNIEHHFRSHDIHAETNALSTMIAGGARSCVAVLVVSERSKFTPCGACLDWIFELGGAECHVGFQPSPAADPVWFTARQLMPHYPR